MKTLLYFVMAFLAIMAIFYVAKATCLFVEGDYYSVDFWLHFVMAGFFTGVTLVGISENIKHKKN